MWSKSAVTLIIVFVVLVVCHLSDNQIWRAHLREEAGNIGTTGVKSAECFPKTLRNSSLLATATQWALNRWRNVSDERQQWDVLTKTYNSVWDSYFKHLKPLSFSAEGELKYFVPFRDRFSDCNVVTVGVGGTVDAEKGLFRHYPQCDWLAVDPDAEVNEQLVKSITRARFVKATVGGKTEKRVASIRQQNGGYANMEKEHTGFSDLLRQHNGDRVIDLLIFDAEGAEFGIAPLLLEGAAQLPTICQLNIEIHYSPHGYGYSTDGFHNTFAALMREGRYVPLFTSRLASANFLRMFLVDIKDDVCADKFLC